MLLFSAALVSATKKHEEVVQFFKSLLCVCPLAVLFRNQARILTFVKYHIYGVFYTIYNSVY